MYFKIFIVYFPIDVLNFMLQTVTFPAGFLFLSQINTVESFRVSLKKGKKKKNEFIFEREQSIEVGKVCVHSLCLISCFWCKKSASISLFLCISDKKKDE